jgi:hypothetical protein
MFMSGAVAAFQEETFTGVAVGLLAWRQGEDLVNAAKRNAALGPCTSGCPGMTQSLDNWFCDGGMLIP